MTRGSEQFQQGGARAGAIALLLLVAGIVLSWVALVPMAVAAAGGLYAVELAIADTPLDVAAPAVAAGLFLSAELAYWSLDGRERWSGDPGEGLRRVAFVALLAVGALLVSALLLVLADGVRAGGLALELLGAVAAVAVVATVLVVARGQRQPSNGS
jgi:hypothetical protein